MGNQTCQSSKLKVEVEILFNTEWPPYEEHLSEFADRLNYPSIPYTRICKKTLTCMVGVAIISLHNILYRRQCLTQKYLCSVHYGTNSTFAGHTLTILRMLIHRQLITHPDLHTNVPTIDINPSPM